MNYKAVFQASTIDGYIVRGSLIEYKNGEVYIMEHEDEELSFPVIAETVKQIKFI